MTILKLLLIYITLVSVITFIVFGIDKLKAKKSWWRIPESTLMVLAVIGGSIGALLGMRVFHHKTLHKKFTIGIPVILILQIAAAAFIFIRFDIFTLT